MPTKKTAKATTKAIANAADVLAAVQQAVADRQKLAIAGLGSKASMPPVLPRRVWRLNCSALDGIIFYQPDELVISALPATSLAVIRRALAEHDQQLAFEPPDWALFGAGGGSLGGAAAMNLAGPAKIQAGAARDHLLGFEAVSGRGAVFKSGGRVVKNVTGYDLSKLMAGSYGTLGVFTSLTFKTMPLPAFVCTLALSGLAPEQAVAAMRQAAAQGLVSAAAFLPAGLESGDSLCLLRLESFARSGIDERRALLPAGGVLLEKDESAALWQKIASVAYFAPASLCSRGTLNGLPYKLPVIWRVLAPADKAPVLLDYARQQNGEGFMDWGGRLLWLSLPVNAAMAAVQDMRAQCASVGAHAQLMRAPAGIAAAIAAFPPPPPSLAALFQRVKQAFDPLNILNPDKMLS